MFILNGRIGKDKIGKPTSRNLSVVDYIISTTYFLKNVNDFEVLDFSKLFSDVHFSLHLSLYKNCSSMDQDEEDILFQNDNERIGKLKGEKLNEYKCNIDTNQVDELLFQLHMYNDSIDIVDRNYVNRIVMF